MGNTFNKGVAATQFYLYGKKHFTQTGWLKHSKEYTPNEFESVNMKGKNCLITGANSGIGFKICEIYAEKVYMMCRDQTRGNSALASIKEKYPDSDLHLLLHDCSLKSSIKDFLAQNSQISWDVVILNAGALQWKRTLTQENFEATFACQLAFGFYTMIKHLIPNMNQQGRIIVVSSGGQYTTPIPQWKTLIAENPEVKFDGQLAYAYMKRAQVVLMEEFAKQNPFIKFVSCHPGWVDTPGVDSAYGNDKKYLAPMRDLYQGSEGIAWLGMTDSSNLENGAFYLDRKPQVKHIAGAFFSEGSFTKNDQKQIDELIQKLDEISL